MEKRLCGMCSKHDAILTEEDVDAFRRLYEETTSHQMNGTVEGIILEEAT